MASSPLFRNTILGLCAAGPSDLATQPDLPPSNVLDARCRRLFGASYPFTAAGINFADLYDATGTRITFQSQADVVRVIGSGTGLTLNVPSEFVYPQTVELNVPWSIGAAGQQRDIHFAFALVVQLMSSSRLNPGADLFACDFTALCRLDSPEYNTRYARDRAARQMCTIPIFRAPKVWMMPVKDEQPPSSGSVEQAWFPWQVCTNCIAGRAMCRCSLLAQSLAIQTPLAVFHLPVGQLSPSDQNYGWFTVMRERYLERNLGYYGMWRCADGQLRQMADV